jgi:hypothetical protein
MATTVAIHFHTACVFFDGDMALGTTPHLQLFDDVGIDVVVDHLFGITHVFDEFFVILFRQYASQLQRLQRSLAVFCGTLDMHFASLHHHKRVCLKTCRTHGAGMSRPGL